MALNSPAPTTGIDRELTGSDFKSAFAFQTAYNALNNPLALIPLRKGEGGIKIAPTYAESPERPADREAVTQTQDQITYDGTVSSGVSLQSFEFFRSALCGAAETEFLLTSSLIEFTATGLIGDTGEFAGLSVGDYFFVSGSSEAANNVMFLVTAKADDENITTYPAPTVAATGDAITIKSNKTTTGENPTLVIMQDRAVDDSLGASASRHTTVYNGFINTATLTVPETGALTYEMAIQFERLVAGTSAVAGQTLAADTLDDPLSSVQNIENFILNGEYATCLIQSMSFEYSNNNLSSDAAGCSKRFGLGQITLSGSVKARSPKSNPFRFRNFYENGTNILGMGVTLNFGDGKYAVIIMDKCKITEHDQPTAAGSISSSECTYTAEKGQYGKTLRIFRNFS